MDSSLLWDLSVATNQPDAALLKKAMRAPVRLAPVRQENTAFVIYTTPNFGSTGSEQITVALYGQWSSAPGKTFLGGLFYAKAMSAFKEQLKDVPVERICWTQQGADAAVQTIIADRDPEVQGNIYRAELATWDHFPGLRFDFNVIYRGDRSLEEVTPTGWSIL